MTEAGDCRAIAIVGASSRAAAFSVVRSGRQAVTADLFADVDLQKLCPATQVKNYPDGFLPWLKQTPCDAWLYTGALENYPTLVAQLAHAAPLLGCDSHALTAVRSPLRLANAITSVNLNFPETRIASDALPRDSTWLMKTGRGSSGCGVRWFEGSGEEASGGFYQRRVAGVPCSAIFVVQEKCSVLLGVTRQLVGEPWTGARAFQYCGSIAPHGLSSAATATVKQIGQVLADAFALRGLIGVDLVIEGDQVWVIEVNPRYTAAVEVVERACCMSAIDLHVLACLGGVLPPAGLPRPGEFYGKAVYFAKTQAVVSGGLQRWLLKHQGADIPAIGTRLVPGEPVTTLFAHGDSDASVERALRERVQELEKMLSS